MRRVMIGSTWHDWSAIGPISTSAVSADVHVAVHVSHCDNFHSVSKGGDAAYRSVARTNERWPWKGGGQDDQ